MHLPVLIASLILILSSAFDVCTIGVQAQERTQIVGDSNRRNTGPVVDAWEPKTASINSIIYLSGYRLYPGEGNKSKVFFIQNGVELPVPDALGSSRINNQQNGPQTLFVIVPEGVVPGQAQIVVESAGHRSAPVTIAITEWKLPIIQSVNPSRGAPGTFVELECEGFHVNDEIELTDDKGKPMSNIVGNSAGGGTTIRIPEDAAEGVISIRIGNRKYGKGQFTEPVTFTVTNEPLPAELLTSDMQSVAPGQWLDLQISNLEPIKRSELTEIAFKQAARTIIVATIKPFKTHVAVPSVLSAGEVLLQLRTWRDGRPSEWSEPASFKLADKPVAPMIDSIKANGSWAALEPGPDRKKSFTVSPGDVVILDGLWPVADASKLKVSLVRSGSVITMTATEVDEKQNRFADVQVRLPESLEVGEWSMIVSSEVDGSQSELPIVIRVVKQ